MTTTDGRAGTGVAIATEGGVLRIVREGLAAFTERSDARFEGR